MMKHSKESELPWHDFGFTHYLAAMGYGAVLILHGMYRDEKFTYAESEFATVGDLHSFLVKHKQKAVLVALPEADLWTLHCSHGFVGASTAVTVTHGLGRRAIALALACSDFAAAYLPPMQSTGNSHAWMYRTKRSRRCPGVRAAGSSCTGYKQVVSSSLPSSD